MAVFALNADQQDPLTKEVMRRIERAERDRNRHMSRLQDCYKYALPWRHYANQTQPQDQLDEIFDETIAIVVEDFAADMLNTFTPLKADWLDVRPAETLDAAQKRQLAEPLAAYKRAIFSEMARSNLYQAFQEAYLDLGPGTMALLIRDIDPAQPIHCEAISAMDLLIDRGPYGWVDGRWRKWKCPGEEVLVLWPILEKTHPGRFKAGQEHNIKDGVHRVWKEKGSETWQYVVMDGNEIVLRETYTGRGSCPLIVARWSRDSTTAWGMGPTYRTLPAIKTLNHVRYTNLKNYDKQVDPVVSYEDDGYINLDQGLEPGKWVPRAPGGKAPEVIESKANFDIALFELDEERSIIRRAHYQDEPDQMGKTPPSATQWADEALRKQRRMGTPATNLVHELLYPVFYRFAYLLTKRGKLPKVNLNGAEIALEPISPLLRAQEQEEVVRLDRFAEMITLRFGPEMANIIIDGFKYAHRLAERLGIDPSLVRDEDQIQAAIQQLSPVLGGGQGAPDEQAA